MAYFPVRPPGDREAMDEGPPRPENIHAARESDAPGLEAHNGGLIIQAHQIWWVGRDVPLLQSGHVPPSRANERPVPACARPLVASSTSSSSERRVPNRLSGC